MAKRLADKLKQCSADKASGLSALQAEVERLQAELAAGPAALERDKLLLELRGKVAALKAKNKSLMEALAESEVREEAILDIQDEPTRRKWERMVAKPGPGSSAIAVMCDWHTEERVEAKLIDGLNEFNLEVAERRVRRAFEKVVYFLEFSRGFAKIDELVLALIGDLITGYIHEELVENNYLSPVEACLFVQDMLCSGIDYLKKEAGVKRILVPCCHGNHGRTSPKKLVSTGYKNSFEWQLYHQVARHYRGDRQVAFKVADGIHNWVEVQGHPVRFHHGDHIRYQGGVGGISIPVNKKIAAWNKARVAGLDVFGHWHQFLQHWSWVSCGCLIGYNAYAQSIGADWQPPTQTFIVVSRDHGKVMAVPTFPDDKPPASVVAANRAKARARQGVAA